ncbi:type II secretion system protein [bacterium]|nr:type II secretion system protein [bacterium]
MKLRAFTLAEILIVLMIIGVIAVLMLRNLRSDDFKEKTYIAKAYKAIDTFDQASSQIRDVESTNCPLGLLMYKSGFNADGSYDFEIGVVNSSGNVVNAQEALDIYGEHVKFEKSGFSFCDYTKYCEIQKAKGNDIEPDDIPGAKLPGDIYVGIKMDGVIDCPNFYLPESNGVLTVRADMKGNMPKCWAKLFIDVNGVDGPNEEGKDIYIYGLDALGVHH